jgi:hypothetical protein
MPYPMLRTGGAKTFSTQLFSQSNSPIDFPEGTTFSALSSVASVATAAVSSDGKIITVTPTGTLTGNIYVDLFATIPGFVADIAGTILIHVMNSPLSETEFIQLTPVT